MTPHSPTRQPIEIHRIPVSDTRRSDCPACGAAVLTPAATRFIAAFQVGAGRILPACPGCAALDDPTVSDAVEALNRLSRCLPKLEWRHATRCIGALDLLAQEVVDDTPQEQVDRTTGGHAEARRAVLALIARQCLGVSELSLRDTVGDADPWSVVEILSNIVAAKLSEGTDDIERWIQATFLEIASGEDE